jgi:alginate O-acetyltransferase complex protein AlgI
MNFNSYSYIFVFLPLVVVVYSFLNSRCSSFSARFWLLIVSLFYYGSLSPRSLPVLALSVIVNYAIGSRLLKRSTEERLRKSVLVSGITFNLILLGFFKYTNWFIVNYNELLGVDFHLFGVILPLGVSFFTFMQLTFIVDCYRLNIRDCNLFSYSLFCTFFPYIVSGPITRYKEIVPQLDQGTIKGIDWKNASQGLYVFTLGLFKKVVIADSLALWVNNGFDKAASLNFLEAWATSLCYTMQLYFDFSGYTDMAIGSALMLNISLPLNFNSPYKALNIQEFWRRWHITLSRFMRDYIYIPLGGNKGGELATYRNLFLTFILGGIWHGAGWNFILWGALHGLGLIVHRVWKKTNIKMHKAFAWFITFNFINICWVFFRAQDIKSAFKVLRGMFFPDSLPLPAFLLQKFEFMQNMPLFIPVKNPFRAIDGSYEMILLLLSSFVIILLFKNSQEYFQELTPSKKSKYFILILLYSVLEMGKLSRFLYVQF